MLIIIISKQSGATKDLRNRFRNCSITALRNQLMKKLIFGLGILICYIAGAQKAAHSFALSDSLFLLDGKPFQIISGEMHYPRVPREAWRQRMKMARAMGLNTIGTYIFWNLHEPQKGQYDFS